MIVSKLPFIMTSNIIKKEAPGTVPDKTISPRPWFKTMVSLSDYSLVYNEILSVFR